MAVPLTFHSFLPFSLFLLSHLSLPSSAEQPTVHKPNPPCPPFDCGELINVGFPFSNITNSECLFDSMYCEKVKKPTIQFKVGGGSYVVKKIMYYENMIVIQDKEFYNQPQSHFCNFLYNFSVPESPFLTFKLITHIYAFVNCKYDHGPLFDYNHTRCGDDNLYYSRGEHRPPLHWNDCSVTRFPLFTWPPDLYDKFNNGIQLQWELTEECTECYKKGGLCRHNSTGSFICSYPGEKRDQDKKKVIHNAIGISLGVAVFFLACIFLFFFHRKATCKPIFFWNKKSKGDHDVEEFLKNYGSLVPNRYQYSDLKKMTNSFKDKLGQGGYGGVFKGKLHDGRLVAVKVLNNSKCNGEEFMNEVASIGKTYHVNIVSLQGFCSEGPKRALIYEFMANGSLEKFIYAEKSREMNPLGWEKLYEITIGIARGLEYLHHGCSTRIVHLDIKPHNILLDEDFRPKISDFGLAKICHAKESAISMIGARGTVGYIAPEVFCRNFGVVSSKSDVYSYGMMVLEMVGVRNRNIEANVENSSEVYFPQWIYKHLDSKGHLGLLGVTMKEEEDIVQKMIIVGLWCIQTDPADRPSTSRVVEMLEGSVESLSIPPKPFLSSPSRTPQETSTASIS